VGPVPTGAGVTAALPATGPAPEAELARDLARRGLLAAPVLLLVGGLGWGIGGALSAGYGLVLVVANFAIAAALLAWAAPISLGVFMAAALFGYLLRLALLFAAVVLVRDAGWVELWPLGLTLIVTHLGLLAWEARSVSASLAFPALKPRRTR
jgi:hypothetical protein